MQNEYLKYREILKNRRAVAVDFGLKRVGLAACDEFHITVSPRDFFLRDSDSFWDKLIQSIEKENPALIIVGVPYRLDGKSSEVIEEIKLFIKDLKSKINVEIIEYDESFSTKKSMSVMIEAGKKKKSRAQKGNADKIAAAIILKEFLFELEG